MELELTLKITRTRDDLTTELQIAKGRAGPRFLSRETETKFLLTAYLKGFKRERIKIGINEDGTQISISGEKSIQEMVMVKWVMYKKEPEISGFCKVFWIPDGVILDRIKAKFNEEDSILTIVMPKKTRGIRGTEIEEVKQQHFDNERSQTMADKDPKGDDATRIGETSSESPQISHEGEPSELASPGTIQVPPTTTPEYRKEITRSEEVELDGELNQSNTPGSLSSEEMLQPEETEEHEIPEDMAPEGGLHEHDLGPDSTEPERVLHEPQMPPTQQIGNEELPLEERTTPLAAQEPKKEPKEQDQGSEIRKPIGQPETPDQDQPLAQEIEDNALNRAEEVHKEMPKVREEEVIDGVVPQGKDLTDGEMLRGELPILQPEETKEHQIPEDMAPEGELHEHDLSPDSTEPERVLHEPQMPPTQQIGNEELPLEERTTPLAAQEPKKEPKEQDQGSEIRKPIGQPETPDQDQPLAQEIEDHALDRAEEVHYEMSKVQEEEVIDGIVLQGKDRTDGEMLRGELPLLQPEETKEHQIPEDMAPEGELHEHDLSPDSTEPERVLHEPQMPPAQQIGNEELLLEGITTPLAAQEPKKEPKEQDQGSEIRKPIGQPETPDQDQPLAQEIEDHALDRAEEVHDEMSKVQEEEVIDGVVLQGKDRTDGEMLRGELPILQPEETKEHQIPEDMAPEGELHEHDLSPDSTESEWVLHEPQTPPTQQTGNEELPLEERTTPLAAKEPKKEPKEQDQGSEIRKPSGQPKTPDQDQPLAQEIEDHALDRAEEVHEEMSKVQEEEVIDGVVLQGKDLTDGERDEEEMAKSEESDDESSELDLAETIEVPATTIPEHREEITRLDELKVEPDGELNQSHTPDSLLSEQLPCGEPPIQCPEEIEQYDRDNGKEPSEGKAPEAMAVLADKETRREYAQEELQPKTEEPKPLIREDDDQIGEASSESPKISHEEEPSELASPETLEVPTTTILEYKEEIIRSQEHNVEPDGELKQSNAPDSLPSEEMLPAKLPILQPEEAKEQEISKAKAPKIMVVLADKAPKRENVQEELQPKTEEPKPMTIEDNDQIGETSSESPQISHEDEPSKLASPETVEVPTTTLTECREEITISEELKVKPGGEFNQPNAPDSLLSKEMLCGELPMLQTDKEHKIPKAEAPESMAILADKDPKRDDFQQELQTESEAAPKAMTREDELIGETSSKSPKISNKEESSELFSPKTIEDPTTTIWEHREEITRPEELKVEPNGELNHSSTADSLPSKQMLHGELPVQEPEKKGEHKILKANAPETLVGKDPKRDDVQKELQPQTEATPKPMTREDDYRIGETSLESPKISHEEESSEFASPNTIEVPAPTIQEHREEITRAEELKVEPDGELNKSNTPDSLLSKEMLCGEPHVQEPEKTEEHLTIESKALETMTVLVDKGPKRKDVQEEFQLEKEDPITREDDNRSGEASSKSPKISHDEEASVLASPETLEVLAATIPEYRGEVTRQREPEVEPNGELNESRAPDSPFSVEIPCGELPVFQPEETEEHEIPEAKATEGELHEHNLSPYAAQLEQRLHEPQNSEMPLTQQTGTEVLPREEISQVANKEPEQEPKEQDRGSKIEKPETLDRDQAVAQEIEDHKLDGAEEVTDGVVVSKGEDQTEGEPDEEGFAKSEDSDKEESANESVSDLSTQTQGEPDEAGLAESKEADKEESPKVELKKSISNRSSQTEGEPDDEGFTELEEINKEESAKAELKNSELKKSVSHRSTQTEGEPDDGGFAESDKEESSKKSVLSTQTQGEPHEARLAESKEASKEKSQKAELKKSTSDRSTQTEREPDDEGLAEPEEEDKEESPKAELKKSVSDRSTQTEAEPDDEEVDKEDFSKAELKKSFTDRSTQTERSHSRKPSLCPSLFAGSAFLVSLILLAIQLLRSKKKQKPI